MLLCDHRRVVRLCKCFADCPAMVPCRTPFRYRIVAIILRLYSCTSLSSTATRLCIIHKHSHLKFGCIVSALIPWKQFRRRGRACDTKHAVDTLWRQRDGLRKSASLLITLGDTGSRECQIARVQGDRIDAREHSRGAQGQARPYIRTINDLVLTKQTVQRRIDNMLHSMLSLDISTNSLIFALPDPPQSFATTNNKQQH